MPSHRPSPGTASLPARGIGRVPSGCSVRLRGDKGAGEVRAGRTGGAEEGATGEGNKGAENDEKSQES